MVLNLLGYNFDSTYPFNMQASCVVPHSFHTESVLEFGLEYLVKVLD